MAKAKKKGNNRRMDTYPSEEASCLDCLVDLVHSEEILYTLAVDVSICRVECPGLFHPLGSLLQITSMLRGREILLL
jgi:hypothetical protein